jgi:hypothetical protein
MPKIALSDQILHKKLLPAVELVAGGRADGGATAEGPEVTSQQHRKLSILQPQPE